MQALIDGDLVAYINAASAENDPKEIAVLRTDKFVRDILETIQADSYRLFLSGADNFRYEVDPLYKANRKELKEPQWRDVCKEFLVTEWNAEVTEGYEADDALGINQTRETIICSIDKDLNMIPGMHYSWPIVRGGKVVREGSTYYVTEIEGLKSFYRSLLVGDRTDNIIGAAGIGKVKAAKIIDPLETELEMFHAVKDIYNDNTRLLKNGRLLWIMREAHKQWHFPLENPSLPEGVMW